MTDAVLLALEYLGVFVFAMTGALVGVRLGFDVVGLLVLALITGLAGGIMRDVLLGVTPPANISSWELLGVATLAVPVVFWQHARIARREREIMVLDALGLATFCVTGTVAALEHDAPAPGAVLLGVLTAIGGGMVRDALSNRVPVVFTGELYAIPAVIGATLTAVAWELDAPGIALVLPALVCLVLRLLSMRRSWSAPTPR